MDTTKQSTQSATKTNSSSFTLCLATAMSLLVMYIMGVYAYGSKSGAVSSSSSRESRAPYAKSASNRYNKKKNKMFDNIILHEQQSTLEGTNSDSDGSDIESSISGSHSSLAALYNAFGRGDSDLIESVNISSARDWIHHFSSNQDSNSSSMERAGSRWGSYSPGIYFGLKTRSSPTSLATGILWRGGGEDKFRYRTNDNELNTFYWRRHNGVDFGEEVLVDSASNANITASFLTAATPETTTPHPAWTQLLQVSDHLEGSGSAKQLLFYIGVECSKGLDALYETLTTTSLSGDKIINGIRQLKSLSTTSKKGGPYYFIGNNIISNHFMLKVSVSSPDEDALDVSFCGLSDIDTRNGVKSLLDNRKTVNNLNPRLSIFGPSNALNNEIEDRSSFLAINVRSSGEYTVHIDFFENIGNRYFDNGLAVDEALIKWREEVVSKIDSTHSDSIHSAIQGREKEFDTKFGDCFVIPPAITLDDSNSTAYTFTGGDFETAKRAISALVGGIGFFHGVPDIADGYDHGADGQVVSPEKGTKSSTHDAISLLTATPSRTAFPRGFLWDEGFHQLVIMHWLPELSMDVISSWLDAMYRYAPGEGGDSTGVDIGWVPREMILGDEARSRVPLEFITQRVNIANPPTLLLVVEGLLAKARALPAESALRRNIEAFLRGALPKVTRWVNWFLVTQKGSEIGTFRWRGRGVAMEHKLSPNTLASGLDDFPRSQIPTSHEKHLDLLCWVAKACKIAAELHLFVQQDDTASSVDNYEEIYTDLLRTIDSTHWSDAHNSYLDVGVYAASTTVITELYIRCSKPNVVSPTPGNNQEKTFVDMTLPLEFAARDTSGNIDYAKVCPAAFPKFQQVHKDHEGRPSFRETVVHNPAEQLAVRHIPRTGYIAIFPLILELLSLDSVRFGSVLDLVESPTHLWSEHGLRSLSTADTFYQRSNAPGDNPYWRGPIWININYLALKALYAYKGSVYAGDREDVRSVAVFDANRARCRSVYGRLRSNVVRTILSSYSSTGFFWEQYNDVTGEGMRGHPFSGWTTLVLTIMAEKY